MSLAITNTSPGISRLVARLQARSSILNESMSAVNYAYECKYSGCRLPCKMMCFSSGRLIFEHLNVAVNGWGWATMSFFWMGSRAYVIVSNGVARWQRLGTTGIDIWKSIQIRTYGGVDLLGLH